MIGRHFQAGNFVPTQEPSDDDVNDQRQAKCAQDPALLQPLGLGFDSNHGHRENLNGITGLLKLIHL